MFVLQRTSQVLKFRILPLETWWLSVVPTVFFVMVFIVYGGTQSTLTCHRTAPDQGRCQLVASRLLQSEIQLDIPLSQVKEATFNHRGSQVALVTQDGQAFRITTYAIPAEEKNAVHINEFLSDPEQRYLKVVEGTVDVGWHPIQDWLSFPIHNIVLNPLVWICGTVFVLVNMTSEIVTCTFDRSLGQITIERRGIRYSRIFQYPLQELVRVEVEKAVRRIRTGRRSGQHVTEFGVVLIFKSGDRVPLEKQFSKFRSGKERTAKRIRQFLDP
jgi:hypothetical protein